MTAPTPGFEWTAERCALLTRRWMVDRKSASQIAAELGLRTRNAVIGKVSRLGLRRDSGRGQSALAAFSPAPTPLPVTLRAPSMPVLPPDAPPAAAVAVDLSSVALKPVEFLNRLPDQCSFPLWPERPGRLVCGDPTASPKVSWCRAHLRIVAQPITSKERRA